MFWKCSFWVFYYPWFSSVQYITLASFSAMVDLERQDQDQDQAEHVFLESCDPPTWQWLTNLPTMYFLHVGQQFTWKRAFVTDFVFLWHTISYETDFFWVQNLGESLKDEEIEGLLDEGDLEGDGFISYMDFCAIKNLMWKPMSKIYIWKPPDCQSVKETSLLQKQNNWFIFKTTSAQL